MPRRAAIRISQALLALALAALFIWRGTAPDGPTRRTPPAERLAGAEVPPEITERVLEDVPLSREDWSRLGQDQRWAVEEAQYRAEFGWIPRGKFHDEGAGFSAAGGVLVLLGLAGMAVGVGILAIWWILRRRRSDDGSLAEDAETSDTSSDL